MAPGYAKYRLVGALITGLIVLVQALYGGATAQEGDPLEIAVAVSLSGEGASYSEPLLEGVRLAISEANAAGGRPINLVVHDDETDDARAQEIAGRIAESPAALVIGPTFSTTSVLVGRDYARAGLVSLPATATSDLITRSRTTFRIVFKNSEQGEALAVYLKKILGHDRAVVIFARNGYGNSLKAGFQRAAGWLDIDAHYLPFETREEAEKAARTVAKDHANTPVVIMAFDVDGAAIITSLRRQGAEGPVLGGDAFSSDYFPALFEDEPEELFEPGYFTNGVYTVSPLILDSANAETLAFAAAYTERTGRGFTWMAAAAYEAGRLAVTAVHAAAAAVGPAADTPTLRKGVLDYLTALDRPGRAIDGLLGPVWFHDRRGRSVPIRMGRFTDKVLESAHVQVMPIDDALETDLATGDLFEIEPGHHARLQQVVHTGVYVNEIQRVDSANSTFGADFYVWLHYLPVTGTGVADPAQIDFPTMVSGDFDPTRPAEHQNLADGTTYRLWRVQGEFRNDFDLREYPFDRQQLRIPFFHATAASDRVVYAIDRGQRGSPTEVPAAAWGEAMAAGAVAPSTSGIAAAEAFRNLTQWRPLGVSERRENLVTYSALGDPRRTGGAGVRELSGYLAAVELTRRAESVLTKTLIPLLLMTLIMYAALFFPHEMLKEKVVVSVTAALSGAVLLTSIHAQLGRIGYTIVLEYAFYAFFFLSLFNIVVVLVGERFRHAGQHGLATVTDRTGQTAYMMIVAAMILSAWGYWLTSGPPG